jgi:uncharacterized protein (TIGR02145 family)
MRACPTGWHLSTNAEWNALINAVGSSTAGTRLKAGSPDWDGSDAFGFSALPGGCRFNDGSFSYLGSNGYWWTATEHDAGIAYYKDMYTGGALMVGSITFNYKEGGYSVRCVQD